MTAASAGWETGGPGRKRIPEIERISGARKTTVGETMEWRVGSLRREVADVLEDDGEFRREQRAVFAPAVEIKANHFLPLVPRVPRVCVKRDAHCPTGVVQNLM